MLSSYPQSVSAVVQQHREESAILRGMRSALVIGPHIKLRHLRRLDDRLAAHLDGLMVAGEEGWRLCEAALETPGTGQVFSATVQAIQDASSPRLEELFALAEAVPEARSGLVSAFGWVSSRYLQDTVRQLLSSRSPFHRSIGIAACAQHRVDPAAALEAALTDKDAALRARALRGTGELGRRDLLPAVRDSIADKEDACRFWGAWSAVLLGDRDARLAGLVGFSRTPGAFRKRAMRLALRAVDLKSAQELLRQISQDPKDVRALIQGAGITGDPVYVPWLFKQMETLELSRLAGESFSFITGLDLAYLDLDRKPPKDFEPGPNDDPNDPNVDMDPDEGLPWPDPKKIAAWWEANKHRFQNGVRYFMGAPPTREHCIQVLKDGYQRQRMAAAQYLCLLNPGTPLFNTSAPAWRQKRLLERMQ